MKLLRTYGFLFIVAASVIILDQWTKQWIEQELHFGQQWMPLDWLAPYARLVHWGNTGAAFGMFQNFNAVFAVLAVIVSCAIIYYYPTVPSADWLVRLALGLQLGGAVGNLIDRLQQGYVTDFVSVGTFAVWNIADAAISAGVVLMIFGMLLHDRRVKREQAAAGALMAESSLDVKQEQ